MSRRAARPAPADLGPRPVEGDALPFWRRKTLDEMTPAEWESLCDGCGRCCLVKLEDENTGKVHYTDVACRLLDAGTCRCRSYPTREREVPDCLRLTPEAVRSVSWLPPTCGYRLVAEGRDLFAWHPLVSGDPAGPERAGVTVRGRVAGSEDEFDPDDLADQVVSWPTRVPRAGQARGKVRPARAPAGQELPGSRSRSPGSVPTKAPPPPEDHVMGFFSSPIKTFDDLYTHQLQDIYYAENQITKALPKMIAKATNPALKQAFQTHLGETENQIARLDKVFGILGKPVKGATCPAIDGIIKEAEELISDCDDGEVRDAAMLASAQAVEHYEITRYGTLIAWSKQLGKQDVVALLGQTLAEEKATDDKLTSLGESNVNKKAA